MSSKNGKCEILISSCDGYSDLWLPFFTLFKRHWSDCPFEISLITEKRKADIEGVNSLSLGEDLDWSSLLLTALNGIQSEYVLFMLEDFFLRKPVSTQVICRLIRDMEEENIEMLRLIPRPGPKGKQQDENSLFGELPPEAKWRVSTQASIWKRTVLRDLVQAGESAWEFEVKGSYRSHSYKKFYCTWQSHIPYGHHVVERGKWFPWEAWKYMKMEIGCDFSKRKCMNFHQSLIWVVRKYLSGLKQTLMN